MIYEYIDYEQFLMSKRVQEKRAQTAHRPKRFVHRFNNGSLITPEFNKTLSPAHASIYLSRKNSYERLFDRPKPKTDIRVVGKNINKHLVNYERHHCLENSVFKTTKEAKIGSRKSQEIIKSKKIDLVIDANHYAKREQSMETNSAVMTESFRKTPVESFISKY
jgi:hypothetical protein